MLGYLGRGACLGALNVPPRNVGEATMALTSHASVLVFACLWQLPEGNLIPRLLSSTEYLKVKLPDSETVDRHVRPLGHGVCVCSPLLLVRRGKIILEVLMAGPPCTYLSGVQVQIPR